MEKIQFFLFKSCCKNCYINFSVLKADDEIKVRRRRIFTFKTLTCVKHITRVKIHFTLLINFISLCSASNFFFFYFYFLFQIVEVYNEEKQTEHSFAYLCKDVRWERSEQSVNADQDRCKIPLHWNSLFRDEQIVCLHQAVYMRGNSLLI